MLLGGRSELSGLVIFISVVGGVGLFGMLGLVLGPILVATAAGVLAVYMGRPESRPITAPLNVAFLRLGARPWVASENRPQENHRHHTLPQHPPTSPPAG